MPSSPHIAAIIVAAGVGARVGGECPKQYQPVRGKPMLRHSMEALLAHPAIRTLQVVIHPDHGNLYAAACKDGLGTHQAPTDQQLLPPVHGGAMRADSVRAALAALAPHHPDYVLIHDAARPFVSASVLDRIIAALTPEVGVVPTLAIHDTVRRYRDGAWEEIVRDGLQRIQTPQAFPYAMLWEMACGTLDVAASPHSPAQLTDDAALWLAAGRPLVYVAGDEDLQKMTTAADIAQTAPSARRVAIGMGFDVHTLMPSGQKGVLRIGGIDIPSDHKTHGHSDADVALHALVDALLGALADGDIGTHYSPQDARWAGADSAIFLRDTLAKVSARGGVIQHVDLTIICEAPKMAPYRESMRARIAKLLGVPLPYVSVKATTTERLGFTGRGEGIAAQAVATVSLPEDI